MWSVFDHVCLDFQEISILIGAVASKLYELVAKDTVKLDRKPVMVGTIVIDEELRGHLRVEKSAHDWILWTLHRCHECSTIWHVAYRSWLEYGCQAWVTHELLGWDPPVVAIVCVVVIVEKIGLVLQ